MNELKRERATPPLPTNSIRPAPKQRTLPFSFSTFVVVLVLDVSCPFTVFRFSLSFSLRAVYHRRTQNGGLFSFPILHSLTS